MKNPPTHTYKNKCLNRFSNLGFSLIELMISLALGLIIVGVIIGVFLGTSQTYRTQDAMSQIQESGRFAIELLSRDIRQIGFRGACMPEASINSLLDTNNAIFDFDLGSLNGWHQSAGTYAAIMNNYVPQTDTLLIKNAESMDVKPSGNTPANAGTVNLNGSSGIPKGQIVIISDIESCDIFQNTANDNANTLTRGAASMNPGNINPSNNLSKQYDSNAQLFTFNSSIYYVGESTATPGENALRRISYRLGVPDDQELIVGVEDFRVRYGVDNTNDGQINEYVNAAVIQTNNDWENVKSIRIYLVIGSPNSDNVVDNNQQLSFDGGVWNAPDRRMYQVFSSTIGIRNRLN